MVLQEMEVLMKTRNSFVSNSSSASFIIAYDPSSKKEPEFTEKVVSLLCDSEDANIDDGLAYIDLEEYQEEQLREFVKEYPSYKLAHWSGDYSEQGRENIIHQMFDDTYEIYTFCSDGGDAHWSLPTRESPVIDPDASYSEKMKIVYDFEKEQISLNEKYKAEFELRKNGST